MTETSTETTTADLSIEHTDDGGTLLYGTSKGDGTAEIVKGQRWRWGRSIGAWYIPHSRNHAPQRARIEATRAALVEAGWTVEVSIDATPQDRAEAEERRAEQAERRAAMLTERAEREAGRADARWNAERAIGQHIPFGQPILAGHHSQRRAERDRDRIQAHTRAAIAHQDNADRAASAATVAAAAMTHRNSPGTVARRIDRLAAQVRSDERAAAKLEAAGTSDSAYGRSVTERLAATRADLEHWQTVRAAQLASGTVTAYGPDTVAPGDLVRIRGDWRKVVRANRKSVSVETGYSWTDRTPWHEVRDHRPATPPADSATA